MRIILFTGKGGVGKTSVAAATAIAASRRGIRTLITSTDPAHSLSDSFDLPLGDRPSHISDHLWGQEIDVQLRMEESWKEIREYTLDILSWAGMDGIEAEELSVVPGLDELLGLADLRRHYDSGEYGLVVVDCAPTGETLRLLSLPEVLSWYIERIFPVERKIIRAVRPVLSRVRSFPPIASDSVFQAVERFYRRVEGIREILTDVDVTSVRLVVNPEKMVVAEARRLLTYLSLFSYRVDAVIVNRVIPEDVVDPYFANWKQIQKTHLQGIEESFAPLPILRARLFDREVTGLGSLELLAREVYGKADPSHVVFTGEVLRVDNRGGERALSIRLPFADRGGVELARSGDELFIKVGNVKRNVAIPQSLKSKTVVRASLDADWLRVVFEDGTGGANGRIEG